MDDPQPVRHRRKKWRWVILPSIMAGIGALVLVLTGSPRQPTYQGRSVDGWLREVFTVTGKNQSKALQALRAMGPEAVPFQIEALAKRDSGVARMHNWLFQKMPAAVQRVLPTPVNAATIRSAAALALLNNEETRPFVPEVAKLLAHQETMVRLHASGLIAHHLHAEHTNLLSELFLALQDSDARVRKHLVYGLASMTNATATTVPHLQKMLADPDPLVREGARAVIERLKLGGYLKQEVDGPHD